MSKHTVNRYLGLSETTIGLERFRKSYRTYHSRFIHSSWLLLEDLDRKVTLNGTEYTVFGMWDSFGSQYDIMLKPVEGGAFYLSTSKEIAHAMGYSRMRNLVTGEEHKWDVKGKKSLTYIPVEESIIEEKTSEDEDESWEDESEDSEDFVDPLVKALQDDITDDGDMSNY
jgi:hypothetical protein